MNILKVALFSGAAFLVALNGSQASAHNTNCEDRELVKTGELVGIGTSVGFFVGYRWGEGVVRLMDGSSFKFEAKGGKAMEMGVSKTGYIGTIYNLDKKEDFAGAYTGIAGGITVGKGTGFAHYQNNNCVVVKLKREKAVGLQGSLPMLGVIHVKLVE